MALFKKLLIPNRYDSFYIALGVICWLAIVTPFLGQLKSSQIAQSIQSFGLIASMASVGGCFVAVGAITACGRPAWPRILCFFAVAAVANVAALNGYFWLQENPELVHLLWPEESGLFSNHAEFFDFKKAGTCLILLVVPLQSWVCFFAVRWGFAKLRIRVQHRESVTRPRLLMGLAGILFIVGIVSNALRATIANFDEITLEFVNSLFAWSLALLGFFVLVYLPTQFLLRRSAKWLKLVLSPLLILLPGVWFFVFQVPWCAQDEISIELAGICGVSMYVLSLFGLSKPSKISDGSAMDFGTVQPVASRFQKIPSFWCGLFLMFLCGTIWMPFRYDPATLLLGGDFDLARRESMLRWNSKGQIFQIHGSLAQCVFNFNETTDPNIVALLRGNAVDYRILVFAKIAPQVDLRQIEKLQRLATTAFCGGRATTEQLSDVFSQPVGNAVFYGGDVVDGGVPFHPESIAKIVFADQGSGDLNVGNILAAFASFDKVNSIHIQLNVRSNDWAEIARASQTTNVTIRGRLPTDLTPGQMGLAEESLSSEFEFPQQRHDTVSTELRNWLLHSRVSIASSAPGPTADSSSIIWNLMFAFPHRFRISFVKSIPKFGDLLDPSESNHFVFERDSEGNPIGVCLPLGESQQQISGLAELRTLSFDERWVQQQIERLGDRPLADLSRLTKLENLAFSDSTPITQLDFLRGMKSLKHLQIPNVDRTIQPGIGFDVCPSLESITVLGIPDAISVQEFQRLPSLKQLTIVDVFGEFKDENPDSIDPDVNTSNSPTSKDYLQSLTDKLPNVKIVLVPDAEFSPQLPVAFQQHLDSRKSALREKLFAPPVSNEELDKG